MRTLHRTLRSSGLVLTFAVAWAGLARAAEDFAALEAEYAGSVQPLVARYCLKCHSTAKQEGDLDLERFNAKAEIRKGAPIWVKVAEFLDNGEMPPKNAAKPTDAQRAQLRGWVGRYLHAEAIAQAGDPGPVVLRRLNNVEYTNTIRDLSGVPTLDPAKEFPTDGAAGEGFTNTGNALVMSPALLAQYLDAAKGIATHAVLLPDGIRFSAGNSRRDFTDELLARIKAAYARHADPQGKIPLAAYFKALVEEREALAKGSVTPETVARRRSLNPRYLRSLWTVLKDDRPSSVVIEGLRTRWKSARPSDVQALVDEITRWQVALARFQNVGHMKPWVVAMEPIATAQEHRFKVPEDATGGLLISMAVDDAGDGSAGDAVVWENARIVSPGRPDLALRDVRAETGRILDLRRRLFASAGRCLDLIAKHSLDSGAPIDREALAREGKVDVDVLTAWLDYLGIGESGKFPLDYLQEKSEKVAGYDFVKSWGPGETPNMAANQSDSPVRIPGNLRGRGVAFHPSPTRQIAVGWRSPFSGPFRIRGKITHAHPECGNGVTWTLELRRGATRRRLASGIAAGSKAVEVAAPDALPIRKGDLLSVIIGPREGNHACDLTDVDLKFISLGESGLVWDLAHELSSNFLAANPRGDALGNAEVWHLYTSAVADDAIGPVIPEGSLLARWLVEPDARRRAELAAGVEALMTQGPPKDPKSPDALLHRRLSSLGSPLFSARAGARSPANRASDWGPDPAAFGKSPGGKLNPADLLTAAPGVITFKLPADLVAGSTIVATAKLDPVSGRDGSAQARIVAGATKPSQGLRSDSLILVHPEGKRRSELAKGFEEFRRWFPPAICYPQIVPIDEVVTLSLFHREDEPLARLMLDDRERADLDRLWVELHFVAQDAFTTVDAYAQLMEYATQDSNPKLFEHLREPIRKRAEMLRKAIQEAEPRQLEGILATAERAFRRPLASDEIQQFRSLFAKLKAEGLPSEDALRLTLARVFVSPAFLYRMEQAGPGESAADVSDWELATRLSYFLWSSMPDDELRRLAAAGMLRNANVLASQAQRMLRDDKVRRLASEFACQWLQIYEFNTLDEKSERHFPTFREARGDLYEESIRFFTDLFRNDRSILSVLDADHTFLNERLAKFYGIPGVSGPEWRRVDGLSRYGRGGILGQATTLAKQSGASRTSPILRGNWLSEVILGEKLPKPPKGVPQLPEDESATEGKTVRQLVEMHTRDPRCSGCHARIDPFGYSLEAFDAIGRSREKDLGGRPIDAKAKAPDGASFEGLPGLRNYLLTNRREAVIKQFDKKLLGYALGRAVQLSDEPLLDALRERLGRENFRFSAAVDLIVRSPQFRQIRGSKATLADAH